MSTIPKRVDYLIIGAGVHGLSTAWHLAEDFRSRGRSVDITVVDKAEVATGASGIACGVVRNFYYQPAMGVVMDLSFDVWESDPEAFHFHNCEYIALVPSSQDADVEAIYERQQREGYPSTLVQGEQNVFDHMRTIFPDWKARGQTSMLQEHRSGFAFNADAVCGLADKARAAGARIIEGGSVSPGSGAAATVP